MFSANSQNISPIYGSYNILFNGGYDNTAKPAF